MAPPAIPPQQPPQVSGVKNVSPTSPVAGRTSIPPARPVVQQPPAVVKPPQPAAPVVTQPTTVPTPVAPSMQSQAQKQVFPTNMAPPAIPQQQSPQILAQRPPAAPGTIPTPAGSRLPVRPVAPGAPQQPVRIQQPPQTLTALSSMASNRLPTGAGTQGPTTPQTPPPSKGGTKATPEMPQKPTVTATPQAPKSPQFVETKKSPLRFLPIIGGVILLLFILGFVAFRYLGLGGSSTSSVSNSGTTPTGGQTGGVSGGTTSGTSGQAAQPTTKKVTLEYWGLWEPSETMDSIIKDYETANPGTTIKYNKQSHKDYRTRLQNALTSENGPDIFRFHASWVPMLKQNLAPLPSSVMSANEYQSTFYPVAVSQLQVNGQLVGIPLMYDGIVLFYNTDVFQTAVLEPPKTWSDLRNAATKLTVKEGSTIKRAGVALGNTSNVEHFSDVLAVLMLQNGADLTKPNSAEVRDALLFYTNFIKTDDVWDPALPTSTVAFARGDVAMMFAPSWRAHEIKLMNPNLKFSTAPLPQLSDKRVAWGTYWAEGVNPKSSNKDESWKFTKYLSSKDVQQKLFASQSQTRTFGELYSRRDLADVMAKDPLLSAFAQDAPYAQSWYLNSYTHDAGVNDQLIQYYRDAINSLLEGKQMEDVQKTLDQGVSQVIRQYGITAQPAK
jgi:multiple sugar transport system substrate-binding protein